MTTLGDHVLTDIDLDALVTAIPTQTEAGVAALRIRLSAPTTDRVELAKRQEQLRDMRKRSRDPAVAAEITQVRKILHDAEADVLSVADAAKDKRHAEYYNQILWSSDSVAAPLNTKSWFNEASVFFRTLLLPGLAVLMPLLVLVAPFVLYYVVLKQPLSFDGYVTMLQQMFKKAVPSVLGKPRFSGRGGALEVGEKAVHVGASIAMFGASIWNQISAAVSMRAIVADMRRRADAVARFTDATRRLGELLGLPRAVPVWPTGSLGVFGAAWNIPQRIHDLLGVAGELDMLAAVAGLKRTAFVTHTDSGTEGFTIKNIYHPGLTSRRVYNSLSLTDRHHVLLTGPNRGGKSTLLKSLGSAVLMSQTLGIVFARQATMPVFGSIITALAPADVLGKMSLFEAEIEFAKGVKARLSETDSGSPMFLMMDEIFHGTNAHDGVEASQVFLDDLYGSVAGSVFSVVSTHYMELPTRYGPDRTRNMCMEASVDPEDADRLIYTYRLCEGVNRFSSVREILIERGLMRPRTALDDTTSSPERGLMEARKQ
jgi:hypothetical protein